MIYLHTGAPGAGKTLFTLLLIEQMARKDGRQVFYSGINECSVPGWTEFGAPGDDPKRPHFTDASDWMSLPDGAIIVIDEAQRLYRPRHNGSAVPRYVTELETHRHRGLDLVLITQHPGLVDANVRKLVGLHRHVNRAFGMSRAILYEWQNRAVTEPTAHAARKDAVKLRMKYPKHVYQWYKSAEIHTHKVRIPMKIILGLLVALSIPVLAWWVTHRLSALTEAKPSASPVNAGPRPSVVQQAKDVLGLSYAAARTPEIAGLAMTAPIYKDLIKPTIVPKPVACASSGTRCTCYTQQGTKIPDMPAMTCRSIVENGYFDDAPDRAPDRGAYFAKQDRSAGVLTAANEPSRVGADDQVYNGGHAVATGTRETPWLADPQVRQHVTPPNRR